MRCPICRKHTDRLICENCWRHAIEQVKTFPQKYIELADELLPSRGYGQKVSGTRTPPLPVRLETLYLRTGGMSRMLTIHETQIREEQKHTKITFRGDEYSRLEKTVEYIVSHEEWIYKNYVDADGLTKQILAIDNAVKYVLGWRSDEIVIGTCPTTDQEGEVCGAQLRINPKILETGGDISCRVCKTTWASDYWRLLGKVLEEEETAEALAEAKPKRRARSRWTI